MSTSTPIVVLVHGAWHGAWCWAALQTELDYRGIASFAIDLPGHGASTAPFTDLAGDAAAVTALCRQIDRPIVLVGHSYGGAVITEAATPEAGVGQLVYLTAFVPDIDETVIGLSTSLPPAHTALAGAMVIDGDVARINPDLAHDAFYAKCDPMASVANVARLCAQPLATFTQPITNAAWRTIAATYVRCTEDAAIHISHQDLMAQRCATVDTLDTDHSPFGSMPIETAEIIARIARG